MKGTLGTKLVSLEHAVSRVKSGHVVNVAAYTCTPVTLCEGLQAHALQNGLTDVRIEHLGALISWTTPELQGAFRLLDHFATPPNRAAIHAGEADYSPTGLWRGQEMPLPVSRQPDVFLVPVSPPDSHGYCSYGPGVWFSPTAARNARLVIGEIREDFIRTGGENFIHVDQIDLFVDGQAPLPPIPGAPPSDEEREQVDTICTLVAAELINDGDTVQMGVGTVSASLSQFLDIRNDLGIQTEVVTSGIADLVARGIVTGRRKSIHRGKVVGSALVSMGTHELAMIDGNPAFELYEFGYTDDLRMLIQIDPLVAVNNAMAVDLTGQVAAESFDHRAFTGVGGQTVFMIAGAYSPRGKSISVLPSSSVPSGGSARVSRIVPVLPPGTPVTVPRTYVDYVVTEFGIARLTGRSIAERARALIDIAHPDFRDHLKDEARRLHAVRL